MEQDGFPILKIQTITFNDGSTLDVKNDDLIIFVGPNNSGKSASLREIGNFIVNGRKTARNVITNISISSPQTPREIQDWVEANSRRDKVGYRSLPYAGRLNKEDIEDEWEKRVERGFKDIGKVLILHLSTEERLSAASPVDSIDFGEEVESHPIHRLFIDEDFENQIDEYFYRSFKDHLFVNRSAGRKIRLHIGKSLPSETTIKRRDFVSAMNALPSLHEQGDGMRSFVGVLISILSVRRRVILLDEPEAFLHPPQASALGRLLAHHLPKGRQLFVATHSSDFLKGALDNKEARIRVIRLKREGSINRIHELDPDKVKTVWSDPLLRYSGILDGLFHDGVVICEGDTDCRFYSAIVEGITSSDANIDVLFVHGGGKSRIASIVGSLVAVGVPVRAIADFDVIADENTFKKIIEAFGGTWSSYQADWRVVKQAVDKVRAAKSIEDIKQEISQVFESVKGQNLSSRDTEELRRIIRQGSGWAEAKRVGKSYIPSGNEFGIYERLEAQLRQIGLFIVPVGEVEGFCRNIGGKGPGWASNVLELDLRNDVSLQAAREFCSCLISDWDATAPASPSTPHAPSPS